MIAIQTVIFGGYPVELMFERLQVLGVQAVEFWQGHLPFKTERYCRETREVARRFGIEIIGYVWKGKGFDPYRADARESSLNALREDIEAAAYLGASFVTIAEGSKPEGVAGDEAWESLVGVFREAARMAREMGVILVNEFHPGMFASTVERAPRLIDEVGSDYFKGCVDFCHAHVITRGRPLEFIRALKGRIGHVHIGDGDGTPCLHLPLGDGKVDVRGCIETVESLGYQGSWSLCLYGYPFPQEGVRRSLQRMKEIGL